MPREDPIQNNNEMFSQQLNTFKNTVGAYATTPLNLDPAVVTSQAADADFYAQTVGNCAAVQNFAREWMVYTQRLRNGPAGTTAAPPVLPTLVTTKPAVPWGVEGRHRGLRKDVLNNPNTNDAINTALGLIGAEQTPPDFTTLQPELELQIIGNAVRVGWGWQGYSDFLDMIELQVDRSDGKGFVFLAMDTTPGYNDTAPFPATPTKWTYRAIFRVGDAQVGQWSSSVSVMVGA